ncbi:MAG TPA: hypothetical protein DCM05_11060 [Elusimicrobia bacterium]|nr:hypothetical protein [Elusimicrobiota bacterium]
MSRTLVAYIFVFALALPAGLSYAQVLVGEPISKPVRGLRAGSSGIIEEPYSFDPAAWGEGAAGHEHFFRYQLFLTRKGLAGQTPESWKKLEPAKREQKLAAGEAFLKTKFETLMSADWLSFEDQELLEAVWGAEIAKAVGAVSTARKLKDPEQLKAALEKVSGLAKKFADLGAIDWKAMFDGKRPGEGDLVSPGGSGKPKDYLAPEKRGGFLQMLGSPEVKAALADQKSFETFLYKNEVPKDAHPSLIAMYSVLSRADDKTKAELGHILPTVVQFIRDGKKVVVTKMDGALGYAVPGDYDRPEMVAVSADIKDADPLVAGEVLTHEFQHIYDMYVGRYYTLDSEMRSFKTGVLYTRAIEKAAPEKYKEMRESDSDDTRRFIRSGEELGKAYDKGPADFAQQIAFGYGYSRFHEGVFMGRLPLREAVDPNFGAPRELAALRALRDKTKERAAESEKRLQEARVGASSRGQDKAVEKAANDLSGDQRMLAYYNQQVIIKELRLKRMQSEVQWLDKRNKTNGKSPHDLILSVDGEYLVQ